MNTIENIEKLSRKTWLATIGFYGAGWKYAVEKFDETYTKTNEMISDLVTEGEKIEKDLKEQFESKVQIDAKVAELKEKLGLTEMTEADRIDALSIKVDQLTASVAALVKKREAAAKKAAPAAKKAAPKKAPAAKKAAPKKTEA